MWQGCFARLCCSPVLRLPRTAALPDGCFVCSGVESPVELAPQPAEDRLVDWQGVTLGLHLYNRDYIVRN